MKIRNKIESISTIKRLGLNQFPEKIINLTECGSGGVHWSFKVYEKVSSKILYPKR